MWLGIVLHVAINHLSVESPVILWRDPEVTPWADLIVVWIHNFRMPLFFILSGFFAALLYYRRGAQAMLSNRVKRIAIPFILFWPLLLISMSLLIINYLHLSKYGSYGIDPNIMPELPGQTKVPTMHLWFIYYLFWFCVAAVPLVKLMTKFPSQFKDRALQFFSEHGMHWLLWVFLTLPLVGVGVVYPHGLLHPNGSLLINPFEFIHNGLFFAFGWMLYLSFHHGSNKLLQQCQQWCWRYIMLGSVLLAVFLFVFEVERLHSPQALWAKALVSFIYNFATWFWCFGVMGAFLRYLPQQNSLLSYVSESSYWVYLVHMLGTLGFGVLLYSEPWPALVKMSVNIIATTLFCLITYHWLVRSTWIGLLLNGKRQPLRKPEG